MDTSSSPAMRYIKDQPLEDTLEPDIEQKFQLLCDAVDLLESTNILGDIIGNRMMSSIAHNLDLALSYFYHSQDHILSAVRIRFIGSRPWKDGTDYYFLTLKKEWYWIRDKGNPVYSRSDPRAVVSVKRLEWRDGREIEEMGGPEEKDIFSTLLLCLGSMMGQEYEARQARAERIRGPLDTIMQWSARAERLRWSN